MDRLTELLAQRRIAALLVGCTLVLGLAGITASAAPSAQTTGGRIPAPRIGFLAPSFELDTLDGGRLALADFRGQVVVINLWASWCPPCRAEMPAIQALYDDMREEGLAVLAVNMTAQDTLAAAAEFVSEFGLTFPIPLDRNGEVARLYQMRALPSTYFVDRQGVIREVVIGGPMSELTLRSIVREILDMED